MVFLLSTSRSETIGEQLPSSQELPKQPQFSRSCTKQEGSAVNFSQSYNQIMTETEGREKGRGRLLVAVGLRQCPVAHHFTFIAPVLLSLLSLRWEAWLSGNRSCGLLGACLGAEL